MTEDRVDALVIGGGPAGSTAAALLSRAGRRVRLLEAGAHPRPHVGESLLPGITPILADIDALDAVQRAGFSTKTGSTHLDWGTTPRWDLWFADSDAYETSWFVERSKLDAILFDAATRAGSEVFTRAGVRSLLWDRERLVGVRWTDADGRQHETHATHVFDASGAAALVARDRGWLTPIEGMAHQALWAHFTDAEHLAPPRAHQALFVAQPDRWWWCFPLGGGRASVGVVELGVEQPKGGSARFDALLGEAPRVREVLGPRARRDGPVRRERDWSYRVRPAATLGARLVGDAAGFIDPVLSTGVFLAMHSAFDAARSLPDGDDPDEESASANGYATRHAAQFDDLLRMVCFYYRQNLSADEYFWESKRIVIDEAGRLSPRRAFLVLTSGLVANLAVDQATEAARARRREVARSAGRPLDDAPEHLDFVCLQLRIPFTPRPDQAIADPTPTADDAALPRPDRASLYLLIEPDDPAAPCLARTPRWSLDVVAPRLGNDPMSDPRAAPVLRSFVDLIRRLDRQEASLATFFANNAEALSRWVGELPDEVQHVRTFGQ